MGFGIGIRESSILPKILVHKIEAIWYTKIKNTHTGEPQSHRIIDVHSTQMCRIKWLQHQNNATDVTVWNTNKMLAGPYAYKQQQCHRSLTNYILHNLNLFQFIITCWAKIHYSGYASCWNFYVMYWIRINIVSSTCKGLTWNTKLKSSTSAMKWKRNSEPNVTINCSLLRSKFIFAISSQIRFEITI